MLSVAADRMNVLYMGVDNPISVAISGVPADQVKVSSRDVRLIETGKGKFIAKAGRPGKATILVEAPNYRQEVEFRVKLFLIRWRFWKWYMWVEKLIQKSLTA